MLKHKQKILLLKTLAGTTPSTTTQITVTDVEDKTSTISQFAEREKLRNDGKSTTTTK